jgi:hypothetical protein
LSVARVGALTIAVSLISACGTRSTEPAQTSTPHPIASRPANALPWKVVPDPGPRRVQAAMAARLHWLNGFIGYRLVERVSVRGSTVTYYVDGDRYSELSERDQELVVRIMETVATGEWHKIEPLPRSGLTVVISDLYGAQLARADDVMFQPLVKAGQQVP